ncbi:hypothetical protein D9M72_601350 [compost metagenome]
MGVTLRLPCAVLVVEVVAMAGCHEGHARPRHLPRSHSLLLFATDALTGLSSGIILLLDLWKIVVDVESAVEVLDLRNMQEALGN